MQLYDLCLAWNWEYDSDFVGLLDATCAARGLTFLDASARNLADILSRLAGGEAGFRFFLDRASEANPAYLPLVDFARTFDARRLNPRELADLSYDKAAMHQAFRAAGLPTPPTLILPAYNEETDPPPPHLEKLGCPFVVKPALGGGGEGVVTDVTSFEQVLVERRQFPEQEYLLQAHITPKHLAGLPAWFRVIYCLGQVYPCYWDVKTHIYTPLPLETETRLGLVSLHEVTERIARLCRLDLFSTEIALTETDGPIVVDYVNDPIDLRLQSRAADGVPDFIVNRIAARIVETI